SFGRDLEIPRKDQQDWKTEHEDGDNHFDHPRRYDGGREANGCGLNQGPRNNRVGHRDFVNVAPFQLGEEVQQVHGLAFASFWKRESLRTPSHAGSKRKVAAVVPFGFESESCSSGNAFSRSPSTAYPRAASYSELGSSH